MIRGELTNLRAIERSDASTVHAWLDAAFGAAGWPHVSGPVSLAETQRRIESWLDDERSHGRATCLICDDLEGRSLGLVLLTHVELDHRAIEVDLLFVKSTDDATAAMVDALRSATELCFEQGNLHRMTARAPVEDAQRAGAFTVTGFRRDAVLRQAAYFDGEYHDVALYCLLETDEGQNRELKS
jgi:RimJ/RimL family protein N-acetyltransferase